MARIIRTTPKSRKGVSLRVVISFLLFMQIQMPNAKDVHTDKVSDLSFYLTAKVTPQITLTGQEEKITDPKELLKAK